MKLAAASISLLFAVANAGAHLVTSVERLDPGIAPWVNHQSPFFQVWRDYTFYYGSKPAYLAGGDQILTNFSQDPDDPDFRLRLSLAVPATVYLLIDDRVPSVPGEMPWVAALGFVDTGDEAEIRVSQDFLLTTASIYGASFPAGDLVLFEQNDSSPDTRPAGMYTVAVVPESSATVLLLGALALLATARRAAPNCTIT